MQTIIEKSTGLIVYSFDDEATVVLDESGLKSPIRALDIRPHTHEVGFAYKPLADLKAEKLADLAAIRWEHETGGVTVAGADIQTDRDSQALINGAYALANRHIADSGFTIDFKGADGWVSLTASEMIAISDAVGQHVQACFKRERALSALIEAATDVEALETIDITAGWPE